MLLNNIHYVPFLFQIEALQQELADLQVKYETEIGSLPLKSSHSLVSVTHNYV